MSANWSVDLSSLLSRHHVDRRPALDRTRRTQQQAQLDAAARYANVAGAFRVRRDVSGLRILLVDDVYTTGATMEAAARPLLDAGAESVTAVVFAAAIHDV